MLVVAPLASADDVIIPVPQMKSQEVHHYVPDEVLVKYKEEKVNLKTASGRALADALSKKQALSIEEHFQKENISLLKTDSVKTVEETIADLQNDPNIEYAEPNYVRDITTISSDDTHRALLWGLDNTGQTINGDWANITGTADADVDAPEAWAINEGTNAAVVVAVIDIGVSYTHPDLATNMWDGTNCKSNTGAVLGGCNYGYDYSGNDKTPLPGTNSDYHGTHVAGIIAAEKNNGIGVLGIAPHAKIMALRFALTVSSEVKAIDFAIQNGAKVINASFGGGGFSQAEYDAIERFQNAGGIFVAAAGNDTNNNDTSHFYPSDYDLPSIISVAATDQNDALTSFSNYGATSVDVAAPGENIASTITQNAYAYLSGTSMATPYVAGLAGLIWGYKNNLTATQVRSIILNTGDTKAGYSGKTVSEKRINAQKALFDADILYAQGVHDSAVEGTSPGQYSVGSKATYQTAIDAATAILDDSDSSSSFIADGVSALDAATGVFLSGIVPADFDALNVEIVTAQGLHDDAIEGTTPGDHVVGSKALFQSAIDAAQAVANTISSSQSTINSALAALVSAETTFYASVVPPSDLTALTAAISSAQTLYDGAVEGTATGQYAVGSKATLQTAIDTASSITNAVAQATVDAALVTLNAAVATFSSGIVSPHITASADANGTITPTGAVTVSFGGSQLFTITPARGYSVNKVLVDGSSVGSVKKYTFSGVNEDHTISVTFKKNTSSGGGGGGGGAPKPVVPADCSLGFAFSPSTGRACPALAKPADCSLGFAFSPSTGQSCTGGSAPLQSLFLGNQTSGGAPYVYVRTLKFGMIGNDVLLLQKYLNTHGYPVSLSGTGSKGFETNSFGTKTMQAVQLFQRMNGLPADGVVGPVTASRMK